MGTFIFHFISFGFVDIKPWERYFGILWFPRVVHALSTEQAILLQM